MAEPAPAKEAHVRKNLAEAFTAPHEVYTGGILYQPGEAFFTAEPKGREWQPASEADALLAMEKAEAAAAKARR
jgi:hypothetical protein